MKTVGKCRYCGDPIYDFQKVKDGCHEGCKMTKQEEIKEGIAERIFNCYQWQFNFTLLKWSEIKGGLRGLILSITDIVLEYEDSKGVVIKVEKELPVIGWEITGAETPSQAEKISEAFRKAYDGYGFFEPLIKEE